VLTPDTRGMHGAIAKAQELVRDNQGFFMPQQFRNHANPDVHYTTTGPELAGQLERIDAFVAGVGTGGTITGVGRYLREHFGGRPLIVAVEPKNSPVLSGGEAGFHKIQGIGAGFVPENLDTTVYDEIIAVSDEERRKMADSVVLSIKTDNGHHRNYTIQVENHSKLDLQVRCISLWSKGQKVSKPAFPPENVSWPVPAQRTIPIQFDAQEDVAQRLWQLAGSPHDYDPRSGGRLLGSSRQFQIEVRVALRCEIMGLERDFEDTRTVQVDFINRQITGL